MRSARLLPLLLAVSLVSTQVAGIAHALSHYNADALAKERIAHASLCAKCLSFHKISVAVPPSAAPVPLRESRSAPSAQLTPIAQRSVAIPFRARGPPDSSASDP
jgi:hypothetical protein